MSQLNKLAWTTDSIAESVKYGKHNSTTLRMFVEDS